jgi:hypothetical protein
MHGLDRLRPFRVLLDLAVQAGDPDVDAAVERLVAALVGEFEKLIAGQHAVGMVEERLHQVELHGRDQHLGTIGREQPPGIQIEPAAPEADPGG